MDFFFIEVLWVFFKKEKFRIINDCGIVMINRADKISSIHRKVATFIIRLSLVQASIRLKNEYYSIDPEFSIQLGLNFTYIRFEIRNE